MRCSQDTIVVALVLLLQCCLLMASVIENDLTVDLAQTTWVQHAAANLTRVPSFMHLQYRFTCVDRFDHGRWEILASDRVVNGNEDLLTYTASNSADGVRAGNALVHNNSSWYD